jgi:hypothetical protein
MYGHSVLKLGGHLFVPCKPQFFLYARQSLVEKLIAAYGCARRSLGLHLALEVQHLIDAHIRDRYPSLDTKGVLIALLRGFCTAD